MRTGKFLFSLVLVTCAAFSTYEASAQRLIPGQMTVYAEGSAWMAPGGGAGVSFIKRNYKWDMSVNYRTLDHKVSLPETKEYYAGDYELKSQDIYARLMFKGLVVHDRSYSWNLWMGVSFDPGVRLRSPLQEYTDFDRIAQTVFIYGFTPEIALEFFPSNIFSMAIFARPRLLFSGEKNPIGERWFYPEFGMQFNFCFFTKR